jgi:cysteine-rich repeat protein
MALITFRSAGAMVALGALLLASEACGGDGGTGGTGGTGGAGGSGGAGGTTSSSSSSTTTSSSSSTTTSSSSSTTSSSSGTGGTGGMMGPSNDACPGEAHTLNLGDSITIDATTALATDDYNSFCGDMTMSADAPDVVYAITLAEAGTFSATVTAASGSTLKPAIDLREDCTKDSDFCVSSGSASENFSFDMPAGTYYLIVDGNGGTNGAFSLTAKLSASACGDGVLNADEECDPGPSVANDGCGDTGAADACKLQAAPAGQDKCPGEAVTVPGGTIKLTAAQGTSTYGYTDDYDSSCSQYPGGRDRVFAIKPTKPGMMSVSIGYEADGVTSACASSIFAPGCWAHMLYVRTTCADTNSEIACSLDGIDPTAPTTLTFAVTANTTYFVFVDGYDDQSYSYGPFNLIVDLQ